MADDPLITPEMKNDPRLKAVLGRADVQWCLARTGGTFWWDLLELPPDEESGAPVQRIVILRGEDESELYAWIRAKAAYAFLTVVAELQDLPPLPPPPLLERVDGRLLMTEWSFADGEGADGVVPGAPAVPYQVVTLQVTDEGDEVAAEAEDVEVAVR